MADKNLVQVNNTATRLPLNQTQLITGSADKNLVQVNNTATRFPLNQTQLITGSVVTPAILGSIHIFGIIINIQLIITIYRTKKFHTPSYILSVNMAISDIMVLIFAFIYTIFNAIQLRNASFNLSSFQIICQGNLYGFVASLTISSLSFMTISIDRHLTITGKKSSGSPFQKVKILSATITVIWIIGLCFSIPVISMIQSSKEIYFLCSFQNINNVSQAAAIALYIHNIISFPIPLVIAIYCYYHVIKRINSSTMLQHTNAQGESNHHPQIRATKMMILATIIYMLCTLPFYILSLLLGTSNIPILELSSTFLTDLQETLILICDLFFTNFLIV
ncbi:rhodopsin [Trichoplax sp. H2]|nr:rhodopsin [Trichoplax sp. H2]|eukprot:RDD36979.1 rhodopsin [Trichoplax sp. H2]